MSSTKGKKGYNGGFNQKSADMTKEQLGEEIKGLRTREGWSQKKLAKEAGVSLRALQFVEYGERAEEDTVNKILAVFGGELTIDYNLTFP